ncbi:MAG TPA: alanine--tRNA ligase [Thermomicrobiales bacterium]|jgi:alanyl-tRNA synthetase|nr:alanine--tRNA ligase [Thermomicrobiales bacterium]
MVDPTRRSLSPHDSSRLAPDGITAGGAAAPATQSPSRHGWMSARDISWAFVRFFEERGHQHVPSSSLVPHNDPTVLLTTAGMQQMTPYFLGLETPPAERMCSIQKCFRTVDIEEVGDESHNTFFFMLGNFSVGDYFKPDSLRWSWEFLTETMGLPGERLYPSVHPDDDDSYRLWVEEIGVPAQRIVTLGDNWWGPVGNSGPNGPDSEIYFDLGDAFDDGSGTGVGDNPRYLEVWNNVFMQFFQSPDGSRAPLPRQHVDTGMGLERLAMVMQGGHSVYDSDLYQPIIQRAAKLAGNSYGANAEIDRALRIIADHARGGTFLISDGVLPGNEGRGYVLRRILRRAIRAGRRMGIEQKFLAEMAGIIIDEFGDQYPNLVQRRRQIERVLTHEEESFGRTLNAGIGRFQILADGLHERKETVVPGAEAFRLYDTYGFPYDLTVELAREYGLTVDEAGFEAAMEQQRQTSRAGGMFKDVARGRADLYVELAGGTKTEFLGYDPTTVSAPARVLGLATPDGKVDAVEAGQAVEVVLDRTPFYAESGGQVGDTGELRTEDGVIRVDDTTRPVADVVVHRGVVTEGFVRVGDEALATIDAERRQAIRRNHTATHLLHRALRQVLGEEAHQAGSLVAPDRLRFDFTSVEGVRPEQVRQVADLANAQVIADTAVETHVTSYDDAVERGAMALFGEKYGDVVRMVEVGEYSRELCGGTHVGRTGEIGPIVITTESSVASGVRRIEALTGTAALARIADEQATLDELARDLRAGRENLPDSVAALRDRSRQLEREIERLRGELAATRVDALIDAAESLGSDGARLIATRIEISEKGELRQIGDRLRDRIGSGVIILGSVTDGTPSLLVVVTPDLVRAGFKAGDIVRQAAGAMDGRGGGRPDLAEAGGKDASRLDEAIGVARSVVAETAGAAG